MDNSIQEQQGVGVEQDPAVARYENLTQQLYHYADFDEIDVTDDMKARSALFTDLSPEDQRFMQEQLILFGRNNDPRMLDLLRMMGRETDAGLIDQLEQQSGGGKLDNLRIAAHLFSFTYRIWGMNNLVKDSLGDDYNDRTLIAGKLTQLREEAVALSTYSVEATHATHPEFEEAIDKDQLLLKSASGEAAHFEGDGIYAGILGSYKSWNAGKVFTFPLSLADTLPIIVGYNNPQAMANALGEILYLKDRINNPAIVHGLIQWKQLEFDAEPITSAKLEFLEGVLKTKVHIIQDEEGRECVTAETDLPPIVWASACRALRIRRFVPQNELSKLQLEKRVFKAHQDKQFKS